MLKIGLTGGIGSGKSAATKIFEDQGVHIVDADIVAREVVTPGSPALNKIADYFGDDILDADKALNRSKLRELIFNQKEAKLWLEQLLHPIIRDEIINQLSAATSPYSLLVSPLLLETNQHEMVDRILLIDVPKQLQIERASSRDGVQKEQIKKIIASQMSRECKLENSDDIICNDSSFSELEKQVLQQHLNYLELASD